jgi:hypothetical protein
LAWRECWESRNSRVRMVEVGSEHCRECLDELEKMHSRQRSSSIRRKRQVSARPVHREAQRELRPREGILQAPFLELGRAHERRAPRTAKAQKLVAGAKAQGIASDHSNESAFSADSGLMEPRVGEPKAHPPGQERGLSAPTRCRN